MVPSQKGCCSSIKIPKELGGKQGNNSGVNDSTKFSADNHTVASDAELDSAYLNQESDDSEDEMRSTDGEESDPNSPLVPDSQYLN